MFWELVTICDQLIFAFPVCEITPLRSGGRWYSNAELLCVRNTSEAVGTMVPGKLSSVFAMIFRRLGPEMPIEEKDLRDRTKHFALSIIRMFSIIPKNAQAQVLGKQVLRSGTSVGANYREAYPGRSKAEFIAKCGDSLRELEETAY